MKNKIAIFKKAPMLPQAESLKASVAASIGRTIARYTYLESILASIIHRLLEISIKQGRVSIRLPRASEYPKLVKTLLQYHKLYADFQYAQLGKKLEGADAARNILAHSLYLKDGNVIKVQIVRGSWEFEQDVESVSKALQPDSPIVDRAFLSGQRAKVEEAIRWANQLHRLVFSALHALNEKRSLQKSLDRRRPQS